MFSTMKLNHKNYDANFLILLLSRTADFILLDPWNAFIFDTETQHVCFVRVYAEYMKSPIRYLSRLGMSIIAALFSVFTTV